MSEEPSAKSEFLTGWSGAVSNAISKGYTLPTLIVVGSIFIIYSLPYHQRLTFLFSIGDTCKNIWYIGWVLSFVLIFVGNYIMKQNAKRYRKELKESNDLASRLRMDLENLRDIVKGMQNKNNKQPK